MRGLSRWWQGRGRTTGIGAAQARLTIAQRKLADARKHLEAGHDLHALEATVAAAEWLLVVAKTRAEADAANGADKAQLEAMKG